MNKTLRKNLRQSIAFLVLMLISVVGYSQAGTAVLITVQNAIQTSPTTFTYDVMLTNTGTTSLALRGYACGINHAAGMNNGGTITHTFVSRDAILATIPSVSPGYTAASNHLRLTTVNATAGNEVTMPAGIPVRLATMQVNCTVAFPSDFNPALALQLVTAAGKTQCIATCIVTPPGTNYAINGTANTSAAGTLQLLSGLVNTPCFYLNPTGVFAASKTASTQVTCFGGSNGTSQITLSSTGSAAPYGTSGNYKIDGGSNITYTGNPFTVSGLNAGTHTITVTTSYGCTDTAITEITEPSAVLTSSFSASTCATTYTLPWSTVVNASGVYTNTYTASNSCDSIVTATITFNTASVNAPTTATACNQYVWSVNGVTYTASGTYNASYTNAAGCDSSYVLNLTINSSTSSTTTVSSPSSYTWAANSVTYTASGTYTATFTNAANCDSIATLVLTITGASFTLLVQEDLPISCFGNNDASLQATPSGVGPYTFSIDGGLFTNTTGYFDNLTPGVHTVCANDGAATVCDTISFIEPALLTVNFVIDSTVSCLGNDGQITAIVTGGTNLAQGYLTEWYDPSNVLINPSPNNFDLMIDSLVAGQYQLRIEDDHGCFLVDSVTLGLTPPVTINASNTAIACNGGTSVISATSAGGTGSKVITVNGLPLAASYAAGTYTVTATDVKGCSTTSVLNITEPSVIGTSTTVTNCGPYVWTANSTTYTVSGVYTVTLTSASACDSIVTLNLTINQSSVNAPATVSACTSYTWPVNGTTYTASGTYTASYTNVSGCDSSYTLNLTINTNTTTTSTVTANNVYTWPVDGQTYTVSGVYTHTALNPNGCVNTSILNLTINVVSFGLTLVMDQPISCYGNNDGSIQALATGIGPFVYILDGGTAVNSTGFFGGLTPGTHTVCALAGVSILCDTMSFVEPAPLAASFTLDSVVSCHGGDGMMSINITGGTNVLQGYLTWWTNAAGDTLNDILNDNFALYLDSLGVGVYHVQIEDDHGCFFSATGTMVAAPPITVSANIPPIICFGGTTTITPTGAGGVPYAPLVYTINGLPVASSYGPGTYTITATDAKGCTGTTSVTITAPSTPITNTVNVTNCNSYTWVGTGLTYTTSGTYTATLIAANTCDSIVTLNLTINYSSVNTPSTVTACNTYTWPVNSVIYTASGTYTQSFTNVSGCDSSVSLILTINQSSNNAPANVTACNTYTWPVNSTTYTASGSYTVSFTNAAGCDSSVTLNLTINSTSVNPPTTVTACNTYTWSANGATYTASGSYTVSFTNAAGCDSSHTLNLTINASSVNAPDNVTECNTYTWAVNGITYTASGTYTASFTNAAGCDSSKTLNLVINSSTINAPFNITACNTYTWPVNGFLYTVSGTYTYTYLNLVNCVSTHTLNLTINSSSVHTPTTATACDTYTWAVNGAVYTASGAYVATYLNSFGCDSNYTLNLTINSSSVHAPATATSCDTYTWSVNGSVYTASGTYTASYTNISGCDSSYTLNLTINQSSIHNPTTVASCSSYTWSQNATTYTASGTYTDSYTNASGCDSSYTLILTVNPIPTVTATATPPTTCAYSDVTLNGGGAVTYTWSPLVIDGVPFTIITSDTYTVTGVDANGCSNTSSVTVTVTGASPDIVNTTAGNATSVAGSECQTINHVDGASITYHDVNCKAIARISDTLGGNVLGNVTVCATVLSTVPVYNLQPYLPRFFTINESTPGATTVRFYFTNDDFNDYNANAGTFPQIPVPASPVNGDTTTLCISQVPQTTLPGAPGALSTVIPVTAVWNASAARWEITTPVTNGGGFYFHACNPNSTPLPVTITRFIGYKAVSKDVLEWTTSSEQNNAYFNLQHGTDGINFTTLAKVNTKAAGGNSNININYGSENPKPSLGHNYYRLMQVDLDGHTTYESQIVDLIWNSDGSSVTIYPNPTSNVLNIDLYTEKEANTVVKVMDMSGRTIKQISSKSNAGLNNMTISLSEVASGIYTVQILENGKLMFVEKVRKND